jgi:uncharacterized protein DUF6441
MPAKFKVTVDQPAWLKMIRDKQRPVATAAVEALKETATDAVVEGRSNIAGAGRFGPKWQSGLQYALKDAEAGGEPSLQAKAIIFHKFGIAGVFEHGATIEGKPLLWIPTDPNAPPAGRSGKKLVSATVRGQPVLFDAGDRDRHRKPLYIGVPSVRIPKKFRIIEIVKEHAKQIGMMFLKHFKSE